MATMTIAHPSAASTMAAGCGMRVDRAGGQPRSLAAPSAAWTGIGSHKTLPTSVKHPKRSSPLVRTVHLTRLPTTAKRTRCAMDSDPQFLQTWSTMEETYDALAQRLLEISRTMGPRDKYMVALAGSPGSGKSTVAGEVVRRLNKLWREERWWSNESIDLSVAVPMDGFHLYRWQLDAMDDPVEAHARRGAPWTFDPKGLVDSLRTLREQGSVMLPSFDHAVGDPIEDDIYVEDGHRLVIVEGNYLLLNDGAWSDLGSLFDERWYVEVDIDEAMKRVERRHVLTGQPPEMAKYRVTYNDRPNAEMVHESRWNAHLWIQSIPLTVTDPLTADPLKVSDSVV